MNTYRLGRLATISFASLLFVGCDDGSSGGSAGNSGGSSSDGGETSGPTTGTNPTAGSESNSGSSTSTSETAGDSGTSTGPDTDDGSDSSTAGETEGVTSSSSGGDESGSSSTGDTGDSDDSGNKVDICEAPGNLIPCDDGTTNAFNAIGLGCEGGPNNSIPIFNPIFASNDATAWRIITQYGSHIDPIDGLPTWRPREGSSMLIVSTGQIPAPDANGVLIENTNSTDGTTNPDNSQLPAPMSPQQGSAGGAGGTPFVNCDGVNDCSDSLIEQWNLGGSDGNDLLWFQFETPVPSGTYGFSFDFAYFSEEFPTYVDTTFNDMFVAWSNSESYTGNLCFVNDEPCTVTALAYADDYPEYDALDPVLDGTQFGNTSAFDTSGGGTGWFQAQGTTVPGELLQLTFAVFDMGDTILDTSVLIDNFQWDCEGCTPSEVDPCIGIDPV